MYELNTKESLWKRALLIELSLIVLGTLYKLIFTNKCRKSRGKLQMRLQAKWRLSKPTLTRHFMNWAFMSPLTIFTTFKGDGSPRFRRRLQEPPTAVCHCGNFWSHVTLGPTYFFSRDLYEIATKFHMSLRPFRIRWIFSDGNLVPRSHPVVLWPWEIWVGDKADGYSVFCYWTGIVSLSNLHGLKGLRLASQLFVDNEGWNIGKLLRCRAGLWGGTVAKTVKMDEGFWGWQLSGAPNEDIVQNHLT